MTAVKTAFINFGKWFKGFAIRFWKGLIVALKKFPYFF